MYALHERVVKKLNNFTPAYKQVDNFKITRAVSLLYHDVVRSGEFQSSGFPGGDAGVYKLDRDEFRRHLDAISKSNPGVLLTFDDGGVSFYDCIAGELEQRGWRGCFFIATNWVGEPGFLNASQISKLRERGHLIGTHSCSHPARISHCSFDQIVDEWSRSAGILAGILGEPIQFASVPGGYYTHKVGKAAAVAGIRTHLGAHAQMPFCGYVRSHGPVHHPARYSCCTGGCFGARLEAARPAAIGILERKKSPEIGGRNAMA